MRPFVLFSIVVTAAAHPMGNFSVSHDTRLHVTAKGIEVYYVLDLAEVPAFELLKTWRMDARSPQRELDARAFKQAKDWMNGLEFQSGGERLTPSLERASIRISNSANGLFTARVESLMRVEADGADLQFEDRNFSDRPGWKEIVIDSGPGVAIVTASQDDRDRSHGLTDCSAPDAPQDLRARVSWRVTTAAVNKKIVPIPQPAPVTIEARTEEASPPADAGPNRDFLKRILAGRELGFGIILAGLAVAFALGAIHALEPGHGKTIVAAYLVGSRGTMRHAAFLGAMVTFTHTASVFALGLATLFLSKYFVPERMAKVLETISGLSIVVLGGWLLYKRVRSFAGSAHHHHPHDHHHHDHHDHDHPYPHDHSDDHSHEHSHDQAHSHVPEGDVTLGSLIALGASGGLAPCPSAMVLLLFAISVGRVGLGLLLLVAFSIGLAGVLMAIGMLVLYAKSWLPDPSGTSRHPAFRYVPVASAAVIVCIGLVMTAVAIR